MEKMEATGHWLNIKSVFFTACLSGLFMTACGPEGNTSNTTDGTTTGTTVVNKTHIEPPVFNMDSAYSFVKTQCDMGPRNPGSKAHEKCAQWMEKKLKAYGATVVLQKASLSTYDEKKWISTNVIGSFNAEAKDRILLCAHWDTRPFADRDSNTAFENTPISGANDGASGVGVLLEVARALSQKKTNFGIDIIFFDLEDYGGSGEEDTWCLGTQYWAKNPHTPQYFAKYAILLDMVGAKNASFPKEGSSMFYAGPLMDKIWSKAQQMGYGNYFVNDQTGMTTDDHVYINNLANIPAIDIVHYNAEKRDYFECHHRMCDNMDNIDKKTLDAVGKVLLEVIYNE